MNSSLVDEGKVLIKKYVNIGVAVNTKEGLVVPVIRNVTELKIAEIAKNILDLSTKAKNLIFLKKLNLVNSKIPVFLEYSVEELKLSQNTIIKHIQSNLSEKIIIRSSFFLEDSKKFSMAGEFEGS